VVSIELVNTGTELLLGQVTNTHLPWLAQELRPLGLRIDRQVTVPDGPMIEAALRDALTRCQVVLVTGGLGPTSDDITRDIAAQLFEQPLVYHPEIFETIRAYLAQRNYVATDIQKTQAMVPTGAKVLPNSVGTAPGLLLSKNGQYLVLLPGPPRELKAMWTEQVVPWLRETFPDLPPRYSKQWRLLGIGESKVQEMLEEGVRKIGDFEIGYCARSGEVDFRLITSDPHLIPQAEKFIREQVGETIYAEDAGTMEESVIHLARAKNKKIATAESCTGGLIAHLLTNVPGSSEVFGFGWVTYANEAKMQELGVPADLLEKNGAVSEAVVVAMAQGALAQARADMAVAISGIAGPGGGTPEKPVGTVWLAVATKTHVVTLQKNLRSDRATFKHMAAQVALDLLRRELA
jgi:nicotinamide-nucleotide amidase